MISYDLHIHSCLSPCADEDMTANNIVNMALIKGLDLIAVTDHNTTLSSEIVGRVAKGKIGYLYGVEIESNEAVHLLAYFKTVADLKKLESYLETIRDRHPNHPEYFGRQILRDENDEIIAEMPDLLILSTKASINEISKVVHELNGSLVIAHALNRANSIITQLGFIPKDFEFDAIEVKDEKQRLELLRTHPHLSESIFLYNSDAHRLVDINEAVNHIDENSLNKLWR